MTTYELIQRLNELRQILTGKTDLIQTIEKLAEHFPSALSQINRLVKTPGTQSRSAFDQQLRQTVTLIKSLSFPAIFVDIRSTKERLDEIVQNFEVDDSIALRGLMSVFSEFQENFEKTLKSYEPAQTLELLASASLVSAAIRITVDDIELVASSLHSHVTVQDDEQLLSILFTHTDDFADIASKLNALGQIYSELCQVLHISLSQYPLKVIKLETGSPLWLKLIGNILVVPFLIWFIKNAVLFLHRNYTREGRISEIPREIEAADSILQFTRKLEDQGVDVGESKEELKKAIVKISQNLNILLRNQPTIELDGERLSVGKIEEQKFLEQSKNRLLK